MPDRYEDVAPEPTDGRELSPLRRYGRHDLRCQPISVDPSACSCGFAQAIHEDDDWRASVGQPEYGEPF